MKIRDSLTGLYISEEEANELTPERFVVEKSTDNSKVLSQVFDDLADIYDFEENRITWARIVEVFKRHGYEEELTQQ